MAERRGRNSRPPGEAGGTSASRRQLEFPPEMLRLITTGELRPEDQESPMKCAYCGVPMKLVWMHPRVTNEQMADPQYVLPGSVWGKDIMCICSCCSWGECEHKKQLIPCEIRNG